MRDKGQTEVGGFGIAPANDLLYVEDIRLVRQTCSMASVVFDDVAVAEFFDDQVEAGRKPEQFGRIWIHTHPGTCPLPSHVDERTFRRVFGRCDWAVMFILAQGGQVYTRLQYSIGPGGTWEVPVEVDFSRPFPGTDVEDWEREYAASVRPVEFVTPVIRAVETSSPSQSLNSSSLLEDFFIDPDETERQAYEYTREI